MSDSVGQYLNEIGLVPLLTADEERELSQTIERGRDARRASSRGAWPELRKAVDRRCQRQGPLHPGEPAARGEHRPTLSPPPSMELLDLIQEGNLGLEHAVDKFDWRKGFKFSTYATFWIRQAIGRALDQKASLVRLPGDRPPPAGGPPPGRGRRRRARRRERPALPPHYADVARSPGRRRRRQGAGRPAGGRRHPRPEAGPGRP